MARLLLLQPSMDLLHRGSASLLAQSEMLATADDAELSCIALDEEHLCVEIDRALRFWCVAERLTELASRELQPARSRPSGFVTTL